MYLKKVLYNYINWEFFQFIDQYNSFNKNSLPKECCLLEFEAEIYTLLGIFSTRISLPVHTRGMLILDDFKLLFI